MATRNEIRYGYGDLPSGTFGGSKDRVPAQEVRRTVTASGEDNYGDLGQGPSGEDNFGDLGQGSFGEPRAFINTREAKAEANRLKTNINETNTAYKTGTGGAYRNLWGEGGSSGGLREQNQALHSKMTGSTSLNRFGRTFTVQRKEPSYVTREKERIQAIKDKRAAESDPFKVGQITRSEYIPPTGPAPTLELPKFEASKYDRGRVDQLRQRAAGGAIHESRRNLQRAYARTFAQYGFNPVARGAAMRIALEGHGLNVNRAMSSAETTAQNEYERERQVTFQNKQIEHQRLTQQALSVYQNALNTYNKSGTQKQTTESIYGVSDPNSDTGFRVLNEGGAN